MKENIKMINSQDKEYSLRLMDKSTKANGCLTSKMEKDNIYYLMETII